MTTKPHERLKLARVAAGWRTAKSFAASIGVPQPTYALHESGKRGMSREVAKTYAKALGNCDADWLLTGIGRGPLMTAAHPEGESNGIAEAELTSFYIAGVVESGAWRESPELPLAEQEQVQYEARPEFQGARRFGMRVAASAPESVYPNGAVLDCIAFEGASRAPQDGDHVIVHRAGPDDLVEITVKELLRNGSGWLLRPLLNANREPIRIAEPSTAPGEPIRIVAFVIGSYTRRM